MINGDGPLWDVERRLWLGEVAVIEFVVICVGSCEDGWGESSRRGISWKVFSGAEDPAGISTVPAVIFKHLLGIRDRLCVVIFVL